MPCSDCGLLRIMTPFDFHSQRAKRRQRGPGGQCKAQQGGYMGTYMSIWGALGIQ